MRRMFGFDNRMFRRQRGGADFRFGPYPDFTFDDGAEIIAGVDAVQFTDNSTAKGTEISGYFWHFGFAGLGNWYEEAAPRTLSCTRRPANMSLR